MAHTIALQWNIRSINANFNDLQLLIAKHSPIVIALQEAYPKRHVNKEYDWYFKEAQPHHHNVCLGVLKDYPHKVLTINTDLPIVAIQLNSPIKATFISIYLQNQHIPQLQTKLQNLLDTIPKPVIFLGDFNGHHPIWGGNRTSPRGTSILNFSINNDLIVTNPNKPTRISPIDGHHSTLDLTIISSQLTQQIKTNVETDTYGSDHYPLTLQLIENPPEPQNRPKYMYNLADWTSYRQEIDFYLRNQQNWTPEQFTTLIRNTANSFIPRTPNNLKKRQVPWWNPEVAKAIKLRRKTLRSLRRATKNNPTPSPYILSLATAYRTANTLAKIAIKKAKEESWNRFVEEINPDITCKEMWRRVSLLHGSSKKPNHILYLNNTYTTNPTEIAEIFNEHFYNTSATHHYPTPFQKTKITAESQVITFPTLEHAPYNKPFGPEELTWALNKCKGKSAGPDDISYPLLQNLPYTGKTTLLTIYNDIWHTGKIPTEWKNSLIVPIPKPDKNPHDATNYRPISLLNCIGKILERMVNRRLTQILETQNLISDAQHAFRAGRGTESYFSSFESIVQNSFTKNEYISCAIIDISKAFDRTWRHAILDQLSRWGIGGNLTSYLSDFLTNRTFQTIIQNTRSSIKTLENGVPQGAILSPTLFNISTQTLINSLPTDIIPLIYADDILLIATGPSPKQTQQSLQKGLDKLQQWSRFTGYEISGEKSKIICLAPYHRRQSKPLYINKTRIPNVTKAKILGVVIDSTLSFSAHGQYLQNATKSKLQLFQKLSCGKRRASRQTLLRIMNCWLIPKILFGAEIFTRGGPKIHDTLEKIYHRALRHITGAFRTSPIDSILSESGQLPLRHILLNKLIAAHTRLQEKSFPADPLKDRTKTLFKQLTNQDLPETEKLTRLTDRPWNNEKPSIDWTMKNMKKEEYNPTMAQQTFLQLINTKYKQHHQIFTDGSVQLQKVGCGIYSSSSSCSIKLNNNLSIYSAEAFALAIAADEATTANTPNVIFTDSASALEALETGKSKHPYIQAIDEHILSRKISFCWIPSHMGIAGNEIADRLANEGRQKPEDITGAIPKQDLLRWAQEAVRAAWDRQWRSLTTTKLHNIKQTTHPWNDTAKPRDQQILSRIRIGHTRITHSHLITKDSPPICSTCGTQITVHHLIVECRAFSNERSQNNIPYDLPSALNNKDTLERNILNFLKQTKLYESI
uniref:Uncharacterized protein n=2 Tax=Anopheles atroparvus TaxID=41427 RepID=A0AAG5DU64_ANOAO